MTHDPQTPTSAPSAPLTAAKTLRSEALCKVYKKKTVVNQNLADLGIATSEVGEAAAWTKVNDFALRPARSAGIKVVDEGNGGNELISFLAEKKLV